MDYFPNTNLTDNGTTKVPLGPGEYAIQAGGSFGGGTLSIQWNDGVNAGVEYPDGSLTAAGGLVIAVGNVRVDLVLSGATSPDISIRIAKL